MCTAVTYHTQSHYFGRNLDLETAFGEGVTITPRLFPFSFRALRPLPSHYALIGMATVIDGYPLYYDATNEQGLSMAALNFPKNALYYPPADGKDNVAPFELIPWLLGQCASVEEALPLLRHMQLTDTPFSDTVPTSPLHWLLADRNGSVTVEQTKDGLQLFDNPLGILTNNPPFPLQMHHLNDYMNLSREEGRNRFAPGLPLEAYSRGMGAMGLPGDLSSASRFVRAAFTKLDSVSSNTESDSISQFFHILDSVAQTRGCVHLGEAQYEITRYSSCCNVERGIYYYTTYENRQICAVSMHQENLDSEALFFYPLPASQKIYLQNG